MVKHKFSICFSIPVFTSTYKNIKKLASEIFKSTRSGKPDVEEAPHIEGCVITKNKDTYNLTPKTLPVDCAEILLHIKKLCRVKLNAFL